MEPGVPGSMAANTPVEPSERGVFVLLLFGFLAPLSAARGGAGKQTHESGVN